MYVHLSVAGLLLLVACSGKPDEGEDTSIPDLPPQIEIGTGETEFEPLEDGDTIYIVYGPQGGYHFNGSLRVQGIDAGDPDHLDDPNNPLTVFEAFEGDQQVDMDASTYKQGIDPVDDEPGVYEMIGRRVILDITSDDELDGKEVRMTVRVEDTNGVVVEDGRTLLAIPHPLNES
jgi:hypothetical protein